MSTCKVSILNWKIIYNLHLIVTYVNVQVIHVTCWNKYSYVPTREFFTWRRHHCQWRTANFDLYSSPTGVEQWGFSSVSHPTVTKRNRLYDHFRGPMTLKHGAARLAVELTNIRYWCISDLTQHNVQVIILQCMSPG